MLTNTIILWQINLTGFACPEISWENPSGLTHTIPQSPLPSSHSDHKKQENTFVPLSQDLL
jgi:hypothetical protein